MDQSADIQQDNGKMDQTTDDGWDNISTKIPQTEVDVPKTEVEVPKTEVGVSGIDVKIYGRPKLRNNDNTMHNDL